MQCSEKKVLRCLLSSMDVRERLPLLSAPAVHFPSYYLMICSPSEIHHKAEVLSFLTHSEFRIGRKQTLRLGVLSGHPQTSRLLSLFCAALPPNICFGLRWTELFSSWISVTSGRQFILGGPARHQNVNCRGSLTRWEMAAAIRQK